MDQEMDPSSFRPLGTTFRFPAAPSSDAVRRRGPRGPGFSFLVTSLTSCRTRSRVMLGNCLRTISAPSFCPMNPPFSAMAARIRRSRTSSSGSRPAVQRSTRGASIGNSLITRSRFTRAFSKSPCPVTLTLPTRQTASLWKSPPTAISRPPQSSVEIACARGSPGRFPLASSFPRRKRCSKYLIVGNGSRMKT